MDTKPNSLLSEFPATSTADWEKQILADLKGADYSKKLVWQTGNGFSVKPYYRREDLQSLDYLDTVPSVFPFVRGKTSKNNHWYITQDIYHSDLKEANTMAKEAIAGGAEEVCFCTENQNGKLVGPAIQTQADLSVLLSGIDLSKTRVSFESGRLSLPVALFFLNEVVKQGKGSVVQGGLGLDPISDFGVNGTISPNYATVMDTVAAVVKHSKQVVPQYRVLTVHGSIYHNAGATTVEELAYTLAHASDYLSELTSRGISAEDINSVLRFHFSISSNYFFEIAKYRAFRVLWSQVLSAYGVKDNATAYIHATISEWNKTVYDPHVNLLRGTTEAMSAAIAGCDSISVTHFDSVTSEGNSFSYRIARNTQNLLKYESYIDKVVDPASGSYYIENLTDSLASHAWKLFQEIEAGGGLSQALGIGKIQQHLEARKAEKEKDVANRKDFLLGTNQYPLLSDLGKDRVGQHKKSPLTPPKKTTDKLDLPNLLNFANTASISEILGSFGSGGQTLLHRIVPFRAADKFEQLRLRTETHSKPIRVYLLKMGDLSMRIARSTFATNFFGCAGFSIIDPQAVETVKEGVDAFVKSGADILVVCSSDQEYNTIIPEVCALAKPSGKTLILAGYPKDKIEEFQKLGISDFIHVRSNVLETLVKLQEHLGIPQPTAVRPGMMQEEIRVQ
jgi:methylmalonyl-CoA mutase